MTGFERYLQEKGYSLTSGKTSEFNTYDNTGRSWVKDGYFITVGLIDQPTRIGICNTDIFDLTFLPTPDKYKEVEQLVKQKL
jgi:hypothetical protein